MRRRYRRNIHQWRTVDGETKRVDQRGNWKDRAARRKFLLKKFGCGKTCPCYYCKKKLTNKTVTVDRIVPGFEGGTYRRDNILPSCIECNIMRYHKEGHGHSVGYQAGHGRPALPAKNPRSKTRRYMRRYLRSIHKLYKNPRRRRR